MATPALSSEFINRLIERIAEAGGRTDAPEAGSTKSYLGGAFETRRVPLGAGSAAGPAPLAPPATNDQILAAREALGFAIPVDLEQIYLQVADGGFGPADGLAPLREVARRYRHLIELSPFGDGSSWPGHLLPIGLAGPGADCYDLRSGAIVYWDEEAADLAPAGEASGGAFRPEADSLQAWFEAWLSRPPLASLQEEQMEQALVENMRATLAHWRSMSPKERAEYGLAEHGWEQDLFGHLGIDLSDL